MLNNAGVDVGLHVLPHEREGGRAQHLAEDRPRVLVEAVEVRHGRLQAVWFCTQHEREEDPFPAKLDGTCQTQ